MTKISKTSITNEGKRVGVSYSAGPWVAGVDPTTIKIRPRDNSHFPAEIRAAFVVENKSDMTTDYFEADCIRITSAHPLYEQIKRMAA